MRQLQVVVIDDHKLMRDAVRVSLEREDDFSVVADAESAENLTSLVGQTGADVVLLDVRMPGVDGLSLLKSLRDVGVRTPIFVMTGYDSTQVAVEAMEFGATGYLPKPFDLMHLDRLLTQALDQAA